jgi:TonB-dependent starch-binding outer membrane protein SusC
MNRRSRLILFLAIIISLLTTGQSIAQYGEGNKSATDTLKNDFTGSELIISNENFNKGLVISPLELISGKIPGLAISSQDGRPGSPFTISDLSNASLVLGSAPLIILDNMPIAGTPLSINPGDIENITFFRDGVSAGIFGGQAANGVLVINSKQGGNGFKINYTGKFAVSSLQRKTDVFSADEFRNLITNDLSAPAAAINMLGKANTDWQDQIYRTAFGNDNHLSISGSVINIPFSLSVGKTIQDGILKTSKFDRTSTFLSLSPKLFDNHLNIRMNVSGIFNNDRIAEEAAVRSATLFDPTQPVYNTDGTYFQWGTYDVVPNPVAQLELTDDRTKTKRWLWNINVDYRIHFFPDLKIIFTTGSDYLNSAESKLTDPKALFPFMNGSGRLTESQNTFNNTKTGLYLNYSKNLKSVSTIVGLTAGVYRFKSVETINLNQSSSLNPNMIYQRLLSNDGYNQVSEFGNLTFTIKGRYSFNFNLCNDRYSVFVDPQKMNMLPSASFEWNIGNEPFMAAGKIFSGLKLYTSYGISTAFQPYNIPQGAHISTPGTDFNMEKVSSFYAGIFYSFLNDRIEGRINYSDKTGNNVWFAADRFGTAGSDQFIFNTAETKNNSIDFSADASIISSANIKWKIGCNISFNRNKVLQTITNSAFGEPYGTEDGAYRDIYLLAKGYPVNSFFVNRQVYDQSGKPIEGQFVDLSGQGGNIYGYRPDMYHDHTSTPQTLMGFSSDLTFKNWEFAFSGRISLGNYAYNNEYAMTTRFSLYNLDGLQNTTVLFNNSKFVIPYPLSDLFIENASFFRMDYIQLGYRFKTKSEKQPDIKLSAILQNAFLVTSFKGQDPEVASGISNYIFPRAKTASLEVSIGF